MVCAMIRNVPVLLATLDQTVLKKTAAMAYVKLITAASMRMNVSRTGAKCTGNQEMVVLKVLSE